MTPQEIAAAMGQGLATAKEYIDLVVKPPLEQLGELLSERVGLWRLKNRVRCLLEAKRFLEAKGIRPEKMLPGVFVPLLEEAGNTDDPTLSEMFARLLATQLNPATQETVHPAFAKVLGQISPLDAKVLQLVAQSTPRGLSFEETLMVRDGYGLHHVPIEQVAQFASALSTEAASVSEDMVALSIANLIRVGVLQDNTRVASVEAAAHPMPTVPSFGIELSDFGRWFLYVCTDGAPKPESSKPEDQQPQVS